MISDTLFEARDEIRHYQREWPDNYASLAPAINTVCEVMDAMRHYLDTPPVPFLRAVLHDLQAAIGRLDLSVVRAARERLFEDSRKAEPFSDPPEGDHLNGEHTSTKADPSTGKCRAGMRSDQGDGHEQEA